MTVSDDGRVESVGLVNTKALEIAGVDVAGKGHEVKHGAIDVDEKGATGILREDAVQIVEQHANEPSLELRVKFSVMAVSERRRLHFITLATVSRFTQLVIEQQNKCSQHLRQLMLGLENDRF
ncbi:hypothetical protein PRIC1_005820 [Phytophthora ramorum]